MTLRIEWRNGSSSIDTDEVMLLAFPGVGNIGKVAIESLWKLNPTNVIARLHPSGLPPLAKLDEDGLLSPPHLTLSRVQTESGSSLLTLTGPSQPNDSSAQSQMAEELMLFFQEQGVSNVIVLAGMADSPERKDTFMIASSANHRIEMESLGVDVRRDEPKAGAIGVAALIASMGPLFGLNTSCAISTTVGASGDILASQRMIEHLDRWFSLGLNLPQEGNEWLKRRLEEMAPKKKMDLVAEMSSSHDAFYM